MTSRPNPEERELPQAAQGRTPKVTDQVTDQDAGQVTPEVALEVAPEVRVAVALRGEMTARGLRAALRLSDEKHFRTQYLFLAMRAGLIEMTIPDKPRSRLQRDQDGAGLARKVQRGRHLAGRAPGKSAVSSD